VKVKFKIIEKCNMKYMKIIEEQTNSCHCSSLAASWKRADEYFLNND